MTELETRVKQQFDQLSELLDNNQTKQFRKKFLDMHFYEQGQFFMTLNQAQRKELYAIMAPDEIGDMFDTLQDDDPHISRILHEMDLKYASEVINSMYDDNAADMLEHLDKAEVDRYLSIMSTADANQIGRASCRERV